MLSTTFCQGGYDFYMTGKEPTKLTHKLNRRVGNVMSLTFHLIFMCENENIKNPETTSGVQRKLSIITRANVWIEKEMSHISDENNLH